MTKISCGSKGGCNGCVPPPPGGRNFFNFMQFLGNFNKIVSWRSPRGLAPPPRRNPGFATEKKLQNVLGTYPMLNFLYSLGNSPYKFVNFFQWRCAFQGTQKFDRLTRSEQFDPNNCEIVIIINSMEYG